MTSSNGNIFRVTGPLCGEFTGPGEFPTQRPVTRSFDVFFDLRLNKRLSKQPWGWWFETLSWSLWRHCNDHMCNDKSWSIVMLIRLVTLFSHGIGVSYSITLLSFFEMGYHISNKKVDFVDDNYIIIKAKYSIFEKCHWNVSGCHTGDNSVWSRMLDCCHTKHKYM